MENRAKIVHRVAHIDACRGIAALSVLLYHSVCAAPAALTALTLPLQNVPIRWLLTLATKCVHGVDLFFVISGFCLAYPTLAAAATEGRAAFRIDRYAAGRLARIVPPYYAVLLAVLAVLLALRSLHGPVPSAIDPGGGAVGDIVRQFLMLDRGTRLVDGPTWTLFVEFRWYLVFPLLLLLWLSSKRAFALLIVCCILVYHFTRARSLDLGILPAFMLGIVAADWHINGHPLRKHAPILLAIAIDIALLLDPFASSPGPNGVEDVAFYAPTNTGWHLAAFFFLVAAGSWPPLQTLLRFRPILFAGVASYSIYLVHHPIVSFTAEQTAGALGVYGAFALGIGASLAAGSLAWYFVERPFTSGHATHARLISWLQPNVGSFLTFAGIPLSIHTPAAKAAPKTSPVPREPVVHQ